MILHSKVSFVPKFSSALTSSALMLFFFVVDITYIETKAGTRLMTNSWWGYSRHINYFGDLLMALSWCLPTGFSSPIPYFYFFYFAFLLWHRQGRDEHKCRQKYGDDWTRYCKLVPSKIIPGLYYTFTMSNSKFRHIH